MVAFKFPNQRHDFVSSKVFGVTTSLWGLIATTGIFYTTITNAQSPSFFSKEVFNGVPTKHLNVRIKRVLTSDNSSTIPTSVLELTSRNDIVKINQQCPNLNYIISPIYNADADRNGVLNQEEYVTFADAISGGYLTSIDMAENFNSIPLPLKETYVVLSCLCELYQSELWGGKGCCTVYQNEGSDHIGIRTNGTAPDETLTKNQEDYFTYICGTMSEAFELLRVDLVPPPTGKPTYYPSIVPTRSPSIAPTSLAPSKAPFDEPITVNPTPEPTISPTPEPTISPTPEPTISPTPEPTISPTPRPTPTLPAIETDFPTPPSFETSLPTSLPTQNDSPSLAPVKTSFPNFTPKETDLPTLAPAEVISVTTAPVNTISPTAVIIDSDIPTSPPNASPVSTVNPTLDVTNSNTETLPPSTSTSIPPSLSLTSAPTSFIMAKSPTTAPPPFDTESKSPSVSFTPTITSTLAVSPLPTTQTKTPSQTRSPSSEIIKAPTVASTDTPTIFIEEGGQPFTGKLPVLVNFTDSIQGNITAEDVMNGTTNQIKVTLEKSLLELSEIVIDESFSNNQIEVGRSMEELEKKSISSRAVDYRNRHLLVEEATNATIISVVDIECPDGVPSNATTGSPCLNFTSTISLKLVNETNVDFVAKKFQTAMNDKISEGWLVDNFNITEALTPPQEDLMPSPDAGIDGGKEVSTTLSTAAIVGITIACVAVLFLLLSACYANHGRHKIDDEPDIERQDVTDAAVAQDFLDPTSPISSGKGMDDSWSLDSASDTHTEGNTSRDHLLKAQTNSSVKNLMQKTDDEEEWSESDMDSTEYDSTVFSSGTAPDANNISSLAAAGMASSFVASTSATGSHESATLTGNSTKDVVTSSVDEMQGLLGATSPQTEGLNPGAAIAIGAAGAVTAGALAAGAFAVIQTSKEHDEVKNSTIDDTNSSVEALENIPETNLDELDKAIEAGNWGAVGAIAALLAAKGAPSDRKSISVSSPKSQDSSSKLSSHGSSTGPLFDQSKGAEIEKLVEAGDWQGVVLAAARFEADQTMGGESFSASASRSSKWSGSAQSTTTPRSVATNDQSSANMASGRSQAEVKAEVEALVRRVVPEEADNVEEMLTQFKGREEELVETLRRMQERAIASRARLAVQKSAKLEARARTVSPATIQGSSIRSTTKSELEQALEAGNWEAVGEAAKKMSDVSVSSLSQEERERLKDAFSGSTARSASPGSPNEEYNLDALIERGDWPGVIAAAKRASEGSRRSNNMTQEEQEALAQASMWQEIANQSKQEGQVDPAGAGDAAAWAISRSLSALNASNEGPIRTIQDIADEESSDASQYESSSYSASRSQGLSEDQRYYQSGI